MSRGKWVCVRSTSAARRHLPRPAQNGRGLQNTPLRSTHGRATSGVACHHRLWAAHTVDRRRAWHAIFAFLQHTRSNDVGRGMPSSPFDSIDGRPSSGVACHHRPWKAHTIGWSRALHAIIALGPTQTIGHRRAWHAIKSLGQHKWSAVVGRACTQRSVVACPYLSWLA